MSRSLALMTDTETVGLDYNAGLAQIGAVFYDVDTFECVAEFCKNVDWRKMIATGDFVKDDNVIEWWKNQDKEVINSVFLNPEDPKHVAESFIAWVKEVSGGKDFELTSNHILFDLNKLDYFTEYYGYDRVTKLTKYNMIEDFATTRNHAKWKDESLLKEMEDEYLQSDQHNALSDCKWQIHSLKCSLSIIAGGSPDDFEEDSTVAYIVGCYTDGEHFIEHNEAVDTIEDCIYFTGTDGDYIVQIKPDGTSKHVRKWIDNQWMSIK